MRWRYWQFVVALTVIALLCLFDRQGQLRLQIDPSSEALAEGVRKDSKPTSEIFVLFRNNTQWDVDDIKTLSGLFSEIKKLPGVVAIESPLTARLPHVTALSINIESLENRIFLNDDANENWLDWTFSEPLIAGRLFNEEKNDIGTRIRLDKKSPEQFEALLESLVTLINAFDDGNDKIKTFATGTPLVERNISEILINDLGQVLLISIFIVPFVLSFAFNRMSAVILPILSILVAVVWTLAGMTVMGIPINLVTAIVPSLVIGLGLAYSMHAIYGIMHLRDKKNSWQKLVGPFLATGATTVAGFLALYLQPVQAIKQFSLAGAFAVTSSLLAIILILCFGSRESLSQVQTRPWLEKYFTALTNWSTRLVHSGRIIIILFSFFIIAMGALFATTITPGARFVSDLPADHETRKNFDVVSESFGGGNGFRVIIKGSGQDSVLLPAVLKSADTLQKWLNDQPEVGQTTSLVDYLKRLNQVFQSGDPEAYRIPDDIFLAKQLLVIAASSEAERYTNLDNSLLVIQVQTPLDQTADLAVLIARINQQLATLPDGVTAELEGDAIRLVGTIEQLTAGQVKSLGLAVIAIYLMISLLFASFRMGFRAMLPNLLPISVFYGLIGVAGIHLSPTMALVSCIVIGIAVDDTMFYLVRFNHAARAYASEKRGAIMALRETIQPVTLTTVVLCLCFLSLMTGEFDSQAKFGMLAAATLLVAWLCDLTVTPAVGARSSIITLWEVLNVDLGSNPQETIPLMRGMTNRQARLFALLTDLQYIRAGDCFIREGDTAQDMYVIIEGEARVWSTHSGEEIELARFKRGHIIGEMSAFVKHRTANVTAITNLQVLAFDPARLDKIRRRYSPIAALVFRNLNQIQAERLEKTTQDLEVFRAHSQKWS